MAQTALSSLRLLELHQQHAPGDGIAWASRATESGWDGQLATPSLTYSFPLRTLSLVALACMLPSHQPLYQSHHIAEHITSIGNKS